ncbi:MAG: B12-binding domain-containing protein [Bacteroidaceae bacterium]|nr:B12-binding domain-containing protein [Bacteroidaceae bacterium]
MAIMNPSTAKEYNEIEPKLREALTAVILPSQIPSEREQALEALLRIAEEMKTQTTAAAADTTKKTAPKEANEDATSRLVAALLTGNTHTLKSDIMTLLAEGRTPLDIISGPLMKGMNEVGRLFGEGKMFLPQVVKTARTMKQAVEIVLPTTEGEKTDVSNGENRGTVLLATVKGDVHDIGKNIVGVVMGCNGFRVIDLGVMVPCETIVRHAIDQKVDIVCLSGLITPSLEEMCQVAKAMQEAGLRIPLFVGGATTSGVHTAVKIAPLYEGGVFHMRDAAQDPVVAARLLDPAQREATMDANRSQQQRIRLAQQQRELQRQMALQKVKETGSSIEKRFTADWDNYQPATPPFIGEKRYDNIAIADLVPLIDWLYFYWAWRVKEESPEGRLLREDADRLLNEIAQDSSYHIRTAAAFYPAKAQEDGILVSTQHGKGCPCCGGKTKEIFLNTPRQHAVTQSAVPRQQCLALCDFVSPLGNDHIGAFATTVSEKFTERIEKLKASGEDDYTMLLLQTLADRLAEAAAEYMAKTYEERSGWGGIRPAIGYPSLPDQREIFTLDEILHLDTIGIKLTENGAMYPPSSVAGLYIAHPNAHYFSID